MWKLVIEDDEGKRTVVPLTRDDYTVGRKEGNTIRLTERNVSREHARLHKRKNGMGGMGDAPAVFTLEDCTSYNGVYVNGLRVSQMQELTHGDLIQIGDYRIVLQDDTVTEQSGPPQMVVDDAKTTIPNATQPRASHLLERPNRLVMLTGPTPGAEYPLTQERISVGRAEDANISINHNSVSRLHCEIHALGEGRFEIVDKGSSNGVHVNGADLKRGIIEAGDIIELGDVRFKFVGAGQIFLPGVNDSQQLEAISDRPGNVVATRRASSKSAAPMMLFGTFAGLAVLAGVWAYIHRTPHTKAPITQTAEDQEMALLQDARKLCSAGDCDTAHEKIIAGIPESSSLRGSDDFRAIEIAWADAMLARADAEQDVMRKRALLHMVEQTPTVDASRRNTASERLRAMDQEVTPVLPTASTGPQVAPHTNTPTPRPAPSTRRPEPAATSSAADQARALILKSPPDYVGAKNLLVQRVTSGRGSKDETRLLKEVCKQLGDSACVEMCKQKLGE